MNLQVIIPSVNGVAYNQRVDGAIVCHVSPSNAELLKAELIRIVETINQWQISIIEARRHAVAMRQQLPPTPVQLLESELAQLRLKEEVTNRLKQPPPSPLVVPMPGLPPHPPGMAVIPPADPNFNEELARAQTIVGGGTLMDSDDLGPPPETL